MPGIMQLKQQQLFPAQLKGQVLVVTPHGDAAGFGMSQFHRELRAIQDEVKNREEVQHLLINFEDANYFGTDVIGAIASMGKAIRDKGGTFNVTNLSKDMSGVMTTMQLNRMFEEHASEPAALSKLNPPPTLASRLKRPVGVGLLVLLLVAAVAGGAYWYQDYRSSGDYRCYSKLQAINDELKLKRDQTVSETDWRLFKNRSRDTVESMEAWLKEQPGELTPAREEMLLAITEGFKPVLEEPRDPHPVAELQMQTHLIRAHYYLKHDVDDAETVVQVSDQGTKPRTSPAESPAPEMIHSNIPDPPPENAVTETPQPGIPDPPPENSATPQSGIPDPPPENQSSPSSDPLADPQTPPEPPGL